MLHSSILVGSPRGCGRPTKSLCDDALGDRWPGSWKSPALCAARDLRRDREVTRRDGEFEYHIKHTSEPHERIAKESELPEARQ
jgi:hypothetical protein